MAITPITSAMDKFTNLSLVKKGCNYFKKNPEKAIAYATLASLVGKDGIGCVMYVTQSLNNDRIPDDKRRFVASMDLANGILMMASQVAFFFAMRKFSEPIFNKVMKKSFDKEGKVFKRLSTTIRRMEKANGIAPSRKPILMEDYMKLRNTCLKNFNTVVNLVAATILAKRVFVPFVSTPMAQYFTNKVDAHKAKKLGMTLDEYQKAQKEGKLDNKSEKAQTSDSKPSEPASMKGAQKPSDNAGTSSNLLDKYKNA